MKDMTGVRAGRLTVIRISPERRNGCVCWECACDCGSVVTVKGSALRNGDAKGCGCWRRDRRKRPELGGYNTKTHPLYGTWQGMHARCEHPGTKSYSRYGGRGIVVCERWSDFVTFVQDLPPKPSPTHTLERIDNDLPYQPGNVTWATPRQQAQHKSNNHNITLDGRTMCMSEWARVTGLDRNVIKARIIELGWDARRALTTPTRKMAKPARSVGV